MKSFRMNVLEGLIRDWSDHHCSIAIHKVNDTIFISAKTKNNHQVVLKGHQGMSHIFEEYPYLNKAISKYTLELSCVGLHYVGELNYLEMLTDYTFETHLVKVVNEKNLERLFSDLESKMLINFQSIEELLKEKKEDILQIYGNFSKVYASFITKKGHFWDSACVLPNDFLKFFPNLVHELVREKDLKIEYILETNMLQVNLDNIQLVGSSLFEVLVALDNFLNQKQGLGLARRML